MAYAFEKVPGDSINNNEFDGEKLFKWGELLATINLHSKDFEPSDIIYKRMHWLDALKSYFDQFVPENEEDVRDKTYKLMNKIDQIPKTGENFGLTHSDLGHNNIIYHEGNLVAIDFDECDYQYFGYEIAKALYCSIRFLKCLGMEEKEFIKYFKVYFLGGYKSIKSISDSCLKNIPDFLRINNCILYAAACQYFGTENPAERGKVILDF